MDCRETRRLLNAGVEPSSYEIQQTLLGFHLAMCADCRTYRTKLAYRQYSDLLLLAALLSQMPASPAQQLASPAKRAIGRRSRRVARLTSAALAIGALFALSPASHTATHAQTRTAAPVSTHTAAPAAIQPQDDVLVVERQLYSKPARTSLDAQPALTLPAAQTAPVSAPAQQAGSVHVVAFGESLWSIAQRYYGDGTRWQVIYDGNRGVIGANPNLIFPGTHLTIAALSGDPGVPPTSRTYAVRAGDSLWTIAQRYYGDGMGYQRIHQANAAQITNPHWIYPGMVLNIP